MSFTCGVNVTEGGDSRRDANAPPGADLAAFGGSFGGICMMPKGPPVLSESVDDRQDTFESGAELDACVIQSCNSVLGSEDRLLAHDES